VGSENPIRPQILNLQRLAAELLPVGSENLIRPQVLNLQRLAAKLLPPVFRALAERNAA
jgi:hypothetical protein